MKLYQGIDKEHREALREEVPKPIAPPAKYLCSNCGTIYGNGPQTNPKKMERGFCSSCWDWYLAGQRFHWQEILLRDRKAKVQHAPEERP